MMDWKTIEPGQQHRFGRCTVEITEVRTPKRRWVWAVRWSAEDGVAGEVDSLARAQRLVARAVDHVMQIDGRGAVSLS